MGFNEDIQGCDWKTQLSNHLNHQRDWFIKFLIPLTRTTLTQQKIKTLQDTLEQAMKIEAMAGYLHEFKGGEST